MRMMLGVLLALACAVGGFALDSPAAIGDSPPESGALELARATSRDWFAEPGEGATAQGLCPGCNGWIWSKPTECWRYVEGEERIWVYFRSALPEYAYVSTDDARYEVFLAACGGNKTIGTFWVSDSEFSNVRIRLTRE